MRVDRPRRFLDARAWRARVLLALGVLLLGQGVRVVALEILWARTEPCLVRSTYVDGKPGAYVVRLGVELDEPTCIIDVDATPPLATREEAEARRAAWPVKGATTCHRVPKLCGAGILRPHVAAPFWLFPIAAVVCLALGLASRRAPRTEALHAAAGGPFRAPAAVAEPEREAVAIRLPGSGWIAKLGALPFLGAPGFLGAPPMIVIFCIDPLNDIGFPLLVAGMAVLTTSMFVAALYVWFGRRRLVLDGTGRAAYVSRGIGGLDVMRTYAGFASAPEVTLRARYGRSRYGGEFVSGWNVVLSDGEASLVAQLDEQADALQVAEIVRAHVAGPDEPALQLGAPLTATRT